MIFSNEKSLSPLKKKNLNCLYLKIQGDLSNSIESITIFGKES